MTNYQREQAMWVSTGDPETVDSPTLFAPGQLGRHLTVKQPTSTEGAGQAEEGRDKIYRLVQGDSAMTVAPFPGAVMWWSDKSRFRVTTSATLRNARAGVCQGSPGKGNYFFIGTGGPHKTKLVDAPTAAPTNTRQPVIPSATDGKADVLAVGTAPTHAILGYTASTLNLGDNTITVDLEIPDTP